MSFFPMLRQFLTTSTRFRRLYVAIVPDATDAFDTNVIDVLGTKAYESYLMISPEIQAMCRLDEGTNRKHWAHDDRLHCGD